MTETPPRTPPPGMVAPAVAAPDAHEQPARLSPAFWTALAAIGAGSLGFCRAVARDEFLPFSAVAQDGVAALRHIDVAGCVRDAFAFGAVGAGLPWIVAGFIARRAGMSVARAAASLAPPFGVGLLGWAILAWLFGLQAPLEPGNDWIVGDLREMWETWFLGLVGLTVALFAGTIASLTTRPAAPNNEGDVATPRPPERFWNACSVGMAMTCVAYAAAFGWMSGARFLSFNIGLHDLGIYDQLAWNLGHGHGFRVTHYYLDAFGHDYNAEHFMPIMALLAPLRRLWDSPASLLAAQAMAVAGAGWTLFLFARRETGSSLAAFALGVSFLVHPFIQQATMKDFHADALEPIFLFGALWSGRKGVSPAWYAAFLLLLMACKEDASLMVAALGAFQLLGGDWRRGLATLAAGTAWHVGATGWIVAARDGEPLRHLYRYQHLNGDVLPGGLSDIAIWTLSHPAQAIASCASPERLRSLLLIFAPVLFVPLLAPRTWLLFGLPLAAGLGSSWHLQYRMELHYGVASTMFAYAAATFALGAAIRRAEAKAPGGGTKWRVGFAAGSLLLSIFLYLEHGRAPGGRRYDALDFERDPRWAAVLPMIEAIPGDAVVSATNEVGLRLVGRRDFFEFPSLPAEATYLLVDCGSPGVSYHLPDRADFESKVRELLSGSDWGLLRAEVEEGFLLFQRGAIDRIDAAEVARGLSFESR